MHLSRRLNITKNVERLNLMNLMRKKVYSFFVKHCLSCRDASRLASEACERKLNLVEAMKVRILRTLCPYTDRYFAQQVLIHQRLRQEAETEPALPVEIPPECKARIKAALVEAQQQDQ